MHTRGLALAGVLLASGLAVAGCARLEHPTAQPHPSVSIPPGEGDFSAAPSPSASPTPAHAAGGTCKLVDYGSVEAATGTRFEVAAASTAHGAASCALQVLYSDHPDLVLAVADTQADAKAFAKAEPDGANTIKGLGAAAYSRVLGPSGSAGPVVEIAWLGRHDKIVTMRYTYSSDVGTHTASGAVGKLVAYAKNVESRR